MIVGVDIGGTNTDVVSYNGEFKHLATVRSEKAKGVIEKFLKEAEMIGVGIAAWLKGNKIVKFPNLNLDRETIEMLKGEKIVLENDANCFAFYSSKILKAKNLLGVTVGTGIGAGVIVDGKIYRGNGLAGEIGHTFAFNKRICSCGKTGHLEAVFGGKYMDAKFLLETGKIYKIFGFKMFCKALAFSAMLLDPEFIVLGGRIGGRLDEKTVEKEVKRYTDEEFDFKVVCVKDDLAVAKGAALLAISKNPCKDQISQVNLERL